MEVAWNCCHSAFPAHILGTSHSQGILVPAASWTRVRVLNFLGLASPLLSKQRLATWPGLARSTMGQRPHCLTRGEKPSLLLLLSATLCWL